MMYNPSKYTAKSTEQQFNVMQKEINANSKV